ncbi:MAG: hypothetical protein WCC85_22120, partial [Candidatus Sulfotelmatobacter sp.]
AIGKNDTAEHQPRGEEKLSVEDWSSAQPPSLFRDVKLSGKVRCSENQRIAGFWPNPRLKSGF